jgi:hypothetical protein
MCVVSNIGDNFRDDWQKRYPIYPPLPWQQPYTPVQTGTSYPPFTPPQVTKEEFEDLKKEIEALKGLLVAAKKYDEVSGQKNCEMDDKIAFLKQVGQWIGVDLEEIFKNKES